MFTGIITDIGVVRSLKQAGELRAVIATSYDTATIAIGASIACSGACLTVVDKDAGWFAVEISRETLGKTTLAEWREGTLVNLERALKLSDELGGHLVTGHVDGVSTLMERVKSGDSERFYLRPPEELNVCIAAKGSVTLDGVALTVNNVDENGFWVNIIPHTLNMTTLHGRAPGEALNIEIDLIARYVKRMMEARL